MPRKLAEPYTSITVRVPRRRRELLAAVARERGTDISSTINTLISDAAPGFEAWLLERAAQQSPALARLLPLVEPLVNALLDAGLTQEEIGAFMASWWALALSPAPARGQAAQRHEAKEALLSGAIGGTPQRKREVMERAREALQALVAKGGQP
jgi:hypothetical protein